MAKKITDKPSTMERLEEGRSKVDQAVSFVDWVRYLVDWFKGLFGR